jgi:hypothetical protein
MLVMFLDISIPPAREGELGRIARTLRVEFTDGRVLVGEDLTKQGWPALDANSPDVLVFEGKSTTELMTATANWMEEQLRRPIALHDGRGLGRNLTCDDAQADASIGVDSARGRSVTQRDFRRPHASRILARLRSRCGAPSARRAWPRRLAQRAARA